MLAKYDMEESRVEVVLKENTAELIFSDGTVAECTVFCENNYYPCRISLSKVAQIFVSAGGFVHVTISCQNVKSVIN